MSGQGHSSIQQLEDEIVSQVVATIADNYGVIPRTLTKEVLSRRDGSLSDYEAVLRFHRYNRTLTEESFTEAVTALEETIQRDPNHDLAMALLAGLVAATYWMGYVDSKSGVDRAAELGQRAVALNPNSQPGHFAIALVHFLRFQRAPFLAEIEQALNLNPNNAFYLADSALLLVAVGERERAMRLVHRAMRLNPHHPGWYHIIPFLNYYQQGEYEAALFEANRFNTPANFWDPVIRAAVLGQLGRQAEAGKAVDELLALVPDFKTRGRSLIQRTVYLDEHVEMLQVGLRKAGWRRQARDETLE